MWLQEAIKLQYSSVSQGEDKQVINQVKVPLFQGCEDF